MKKKIWNSMFAVVIVSFLFGWPLDCARNVVGAGFAIAAGTATVSTQEVTNIGPISADGNGIILDVGAENPIRFIDWGTKPGAYNAGSCNVGTGSSGPYSCNMIGLLPNTKYYARAKAMSSLGTTYGNEVSFITTAKQEAIADSAPKTILDNPIVKGSSVVVEGAGLAAGVTTAVATGAFPIIPLSPTPLSDVIARIFVLFGIFGRAKKKMNWGVVFDSETRRPIAGVEIAMVNIEGRVVDTMTTNIDGRFGFLASKGEYSFRIFKKDYELFTQSSVDEFYGKLYNGKTFAIEDGEVAEMNIAFRATNVNWQNFAKRKIATYKSFFSVVKKDVFTIIFYAGFIVSVGVFYLSPSIFSAVMIALYLAMMIRNLFFKTKKYGLITSEEGNPIPFAMLSLYEENQPEKRATFAVSDIIGRYFVLTENGKYQMKIQGREPEGRSFRKFLTISVNEAVFKEDVVVDEVDYLKGT